MLIRIVLSLLALALQVHAAEAKRVALVVGQNAYPGGRSATVGLSPLDNSRNDAAAVSALLERHGFEVLSCDGRRRGCFDLSRQALVTALDRLEKAADDADLALIYFAGHGMQSDEGNILAPTDARVDCRTGGVTNGVSVERLMQAVKTARGSILILDACRNNPIGDICPTLRGRKLSFTRIEPGDMRSFLLVTSTQFGQVAMDGPVGTHSHFAAALLKALEENPNVYFEQVMNEVARNTYANTPRYQGIGQIPGKVVGGEAPAACLSGKDCVGDARMAALATETARLNARVQCQAKKAAHIREQADTQRKLLSPGSVVEIKMGSDDAPIVMVEYCAMWSVFCHVQHRNIMPELKRKYIDTGLLLYIYRDIPSSDARTLETGVATHMLAACMDSASRARYLTELYDRKDNANIESYPIETARRLGMPQDKITACLADQNLRKDVLSLADGMKRLELIGVPTVFINNERTVGAKPLAFFEATFQRYLDPAKADAEPCD